MKYIGCFLVLLVLLFFGQSCQRKESPSTTNNIEKEYLEVIAMGKDSSDSYWKNQLPLIQSNKNKGQEAYVYLKRAEISWLKDTLTSQKYLRKALQLIDAQNDYEYVRAMIYSEKGSRLIQEKKLFQATHYLNEAAVISQTHLNFLPTETRAIFAENALFVNYKIRQLPQAITMAQHIIQLYNKDKHEKNTHSLFRAYCRLFFSQLDSNYPNDSLQKIIRPIDSLNVVMKEPELKIMYYNVHTDFNDRLQRYDSAIIYAKKALRINHQLAPKTQVNVHNFHNIISYHIHSKLMELYAKEHKIDSADYYYASSSLLGDLHKDYITDYDQSMHFDHVITYFKTKGQDNKALFYSDQLIELKDSLFKNSASNSSAELFSLYKIQIQQKTIHNLNTELTINHIELKNTQLFFITIFLFLLIVVVVLIFLYYEKKRKEELNIFLLEQQLLRAQMEPHFIFNSIAALQSYIRFDEKQKSLKYLNKFSRFLRGNLEQSRKKLVPIAVEIDMLKNYLTLQQMRLDDVFSYSIDIDQALDMDHSLIPPMLIQPFVENAVVHAFNEKKENQNIQISLKKKSDYLETTIIDNGSGFNLLQLHQDEKKQSLASSIAQERLALLVKQGYEHSKLQILSEKNKGTKIIIIIPIY